MVRREREKNTIQSSLTHRNRLPMLRKRHAEFMEWKWKKEHWLRAIEDDSGELYWWPLKWNRVKGHWNTSCAVVLAIDQSVHVPVNFVHIVLFVWGENTGDRQWHWIHLWTHFVLAICLYWQKLTIEWKTIRFGCRRISSNSSKSEAKNLTKNDERDI